MMFYNKGDLGWFYIKSLHSGMVLDASDGHGGNVKTNVKVEKNDSSGTLVASAILPFSFGIGFSIANALTDVLTETQLWTWRGNCIVNKRGLALDINRGSSSSEAKVIAWSYHGGRNQQWGMVGNKIVSMMHGMCLDITRDSRSKDVDIIVFPVKGSVNRVDNQAWVLEKI